MGKNGNTNDNAYKWLVLGNIMIGTFMAVLDSTVVNTGLPAIMGTLGASINTAEWVLTGYMLAIASILPAAAWLSDRFGYKRIYFLSLLVFTFGSFMCGNSTSIEELIFWRVIEGLGCGAIMPVGMAIVSNVFPPEQRGTALGFWAIASAASVSFGPSIGGYLVDNLNWNYIFYVNVPVGALALFVTAILQKEYKAETVQPFDIPGFITSGIFLPLFMYGLSEVNSSTNTQGWNSPVVLGSMWISALMFILFIYIELTVKHPLINLRIFKDRNFTLANVMMFIFGVGMFGSTFLIPLYLQNNLGYSALQAGMFFIPVGIIQGFCSPTAGALGQKINPKILIAG
ncbi:DHA2 family efflux MFS transporter permease subunit, partial [Parabacteroides sp.]